MHMIHPIIIGAGLAGLAAANHLAKNGIQSTILEARNRSGGRICIDNSLGAPIGKGASWLHGINNNPIVPLLKPNIPFFNFDRNLFYSFDQQGQKIPEYLEKNFNRQLEYTLVKAKKFAFSGDKDISLSKALKNFPLQNISEREQVLLLKKLKFFENYVGDNKNYLSARHWDDEESLSGGHGLLGDAYQAVIQNLSNNLDIRFQTIVHAIKVNQNFVEVETNQGRFSSNIVLLTLPLGVLKHKSIAFTPTLSLQKQRAIDNIGMGLFNIIALRFHDFFWDPECHAFFLPENDCGMFFNLGHFLKLPIILGYVGGDSARKLEKLTDKEIIIPIIQSFKNHLKSETPFPEKYFITRWLDDPFSRGSFSYYATGSSNDDRNILAEPIENRVFFGGEATHTQFPATTHGAYLSGIREAEKILKII